eukprot:6988645-Karenia_brevis.AAC.1
MWNHPLHPALNWEENTNPTRECGHITFGTLLVLTFWLWVLYMPQDPRFPMFIEKSRPFVRVP